MFYDESALYGSSGSRLQNAIADKQHVPNSKTADKVTTTSIISVSI